MMYLEIKGRKAGENRKCTQHRCFAGARSRRGQGLREAGEGKEVSWVLMVGAGFPVLGMALGSSRSSARPRWEGGVTAVNPAVMRWDGAAEAEPRLAQGCDPAGIELPVH